MLQAQPAQRTLSTTTQRIGLTGFRECAILVGIMPEALKDSVTAEDIEGWAANRLQEIGLSVVSKEDQSKSFCASARDTDDKALAANDRFRSRFGVRVDAVRSSTGDIWAYVTVGCSRGVFVHPGYFTSATVWYQAGLCRFGPGYEKAGIKNFLNKLLDELERDWKKCNPGRTGPSARR